MVLTGRLGEGEGKEGYRAGGEGGEGTGLGRVQGRGGEGRGEEGRLYSVGVTR